MSRKDSKYPEEYAIYQQHIINTWVEDDEDDETIIDRFNILHNLVSPMYDFIDNYSKYYSVRKDYGNGIWLTMIEAHILEDIRAHEAITVSKLAEKRKLTSSAISQNVAKLVDKGLVKRVNDETNRKFFYLLLTEKGYETALLHCQFDNKDIIKTKKKLLKKFSIDELIAFDKICHEYNQILENIVD